MDRTRTWQLSLLALAGGLTFVALASGCASVLATAGYALGLDQIQPEYPGLANSKVAVVCVASSTATKGSIDARAIAERVEQVLRAKAPGIKLVSQQEIDNWKDSNEWDNYDFRQIGRGVKADKVLAIDLKAYKLYSSQSLYKGTAEIDLTVYDMTKRGEKAFQASPSTLTFPRESNVPTTEIPEGDFRRKFVLYLGAQIARYFVSREPSEDIVPDLEYLSK